MCTKDRNKKETYRYNAIPEKNIYPKPTSYTNTVQKKVLDMQEYIVLISSVMYTGTCVLILRETKKNKFNIPAPELIL